MTPSTAVNEIDEAMSSPSAPITGATAPIAELPQIELPQATMIDNLLDRPTARLMPTTAATTLRKDTDPPLVLDGPYAETKEQLLGFYVIECADLEAALDVARDLAKANPGGAYEVRPVRGFSPGVLAADAPGA